MTLDDTAQQSGPGSARRSAPCPCGTGQPYDVCCAPLHRGDEPAATAAALMRSRFSAFALNDADYLIQTWHPSTCPAELTLDDGVRWTRLDIIDTVDGGLLDSTGVVEFQARYRAVAQPATPLGLTTHAPHGVLHERSNFVRVDGRWLYVDGEIRASPRS